MTHCRWPPCGASATGSPDDPTAGPRHRGHHGGHAGARRARHVDPRPGRGPGQHRARAAGARPRSWSTAWPRWPTESTGDRPLAALTVFGRAFHLDDVAAVYIGPAGRFVGELPAGVSAEDLPVAELQAGDTVSGHHGDLVYAAAAAPTGTGHAGRGGQSPRRHRPRAGRPLVRRRRHRERAAGRRRGRHPRAAPGAPDPPDRRRRPPHRRRRAGDPVARAGDRPDTDELSDLIRSVNAMAAELQRSRDLEQQFLLSISHDLRTPLTSIRGYAEAISDRTSADPAWAAGVIGTEARRLDRLVQDLLDLARLRARSFSLHPTRRRPRRGGAGGGRGLPPRRRRRRRAAPGHRSGGAIRIHADGDRVAQVVANLDARTPSSTPAPGVGRGQPGRRLRRGGRRRRRPGHLRPRTSPTCSSGCTWPATARRARRAVRASGWPSCGELVEAMGGQVQVGTSPVGGARVAGSIPRRADETLSLRGVGGWRRRGRIMSGTSSDEPVTAGPLPT